MILLVIHKTFPAFFGLSGHFPLFPNIDRDAVHRTETVPRSVYTNTGNNQGDDQVKVKPGWLDNSCYNAGAWTEGQAGGVSGRYCNGGKAQWLNPGKERERSWRGGGVKLHNITNRWHRSKGISVFCCLQPVTGVQNVQPYTFVVIYTDFV